MTRIDPVERLSFWRKREVAAAERVKFWRGKDKMVPGAAKRALDWHNETVKLVSGWELEVKKQHNSRGVLQAV